METCNRKTCIILVVLSLIVISVGLIFIPVLLKNADDAKNFWTSTPGKECTSKICKQYEERIGYLIDNSVDPCDDFYKYACNINKRGTKVPHPPQDRISTDLVELITNATEDYSFIKKFFNSCLSVSKQFSTSDVVEYCLHDDDCQEMELEKFGPIYVQFLEKVRKIASKGAWPVLTENWEELETHFKFDWMEFSEKILADEYYLGAFQYPKTQKFEDEMISRESFFSNVFFAPMIDYTWNVVIEWQNNFQYGENTTKLYLVPMTFPQFIKENNTEKISKYRKLMMSTFKILKANESVAKIDAERIIENEIKLAQYSESEYNQIELAKLDPVVVSDLNSTLPGYDWLAYFDNVMNSTKAVVVYTPNLENVQNMFYIIGNMTKREQANLILWRIVAKFTTNFLQTGKEEEELITSIFDSKGSNSSRSTICANQVKFFFPRILDDLIISRYYDDGDKEKLQSIFKDLKHEFEQILSINELMQNQTKNDLLKKLTELGLTVAEISSTIEYNTELKHQIGIDYLENIKILGNIFWKERVNRFGSGYYISDEETMNAHYLKTLNQVFLYTAFMKGSTIGYFKDSPRAYTYGGAVAILGHELIHAFDQDGVHFRNNVSLDEEFISKFTEDINCLAETYHKYVFTVNGTNFSVDEYETMDENICDNGGLKLAHRFS